MRAAPAGDRGVDGRSRGNDAALEFVPALLRVVATIGRQTIRPPTRSSGLTFDRRDGIDQWDRLRHVVPIGPAGPHHQRDAMPFGQQMPLGAAHPPVRRVRVLFFWTQLGAFTIAPSIMTREKSSSPALFSLASITARSCCQTPASCHSRSRHQQVMSEPQPSSNGRRPQPIACRKTKTITARHLRSESRDRPPFAEGGCFGNSGSIASQSTSGTSRSAEGARNSLAHHAAPSDSE